MSLAISRLTSLVRRLLLVTPVASREERGGATTLKRGKDGFAPGAGFVFVCQTFVLFGQGTQRLLHPKNDGSQEMFWG